MYDKTQPKISGVNAPRENTPAEDQKKDLDSKNQELTPNGNTVDKAPVAPVK